MQSQPVRLGRHGRHVAAGGPQHCADGIRGRYLHHQHLRGYREHRSPVPPAHPPGVARAARLPHHRNGLLCPEIGKALQALSDRVSVIGNAEKKDIAAFVASLQESRASFSAVSDIAAEKTFTTPACTKLFDRTRAFLKIQDGCNSRCTYCIVPSVRGPSRSLPAGEVKDRIIELKQAGYREIVLTGIHLGAFGLDARPRTSLAGMLADLENEEALAGMRLRLSSIEPTEFTPDAYRDNRPVEAHLPPCSYSAAKRRCRYFKKNGAALQPGFFRELVLRLAEAIPGLNIGIDVIAGFPGETDRAFKNTAELLHRLPAGYLHVFPYSRRSGTPAADFTGPGGRADQKRAGSKAAADIG